jgi:zinc transport system substrate-binding protein
MRLIFILISTSCIALPALACGRTTSAESGRLEVVASFYPLAFAAEEIGGSRIDVSNLTPAGSEPHDLEVSPQDVAIIREANVVLLLGRSFQPQLEEAAGEGASVVRLLDTPGLDVVSDDPHVWLDPARYATIARRIASAIGSPGAAAPFVERLDALDGELRRGLADCDRREVVTSHGAFGYLTKRYGLEQVAVTGVSPEPEAQPARLEEVVHLVRARDATTVFVEPLVSPRLAETIARETGAHTAVLDPIEGLGEESAAAGKDYFSLMRQNLAALRDGLGCS